MKDNAPYANLAKVAKKLLENASAKKKNNQIISSKLSHKTGG